MYIFVDSYRRYGEPTVELLKMKAADFSKSSTFEDGRNGFLRDLAVYHTSRVTVAALSFATSLKISGLAKFCSIPHLPLSSYILGPYFPLNAPPPPLSRTVSS